MGVSANCLNCPHRNASINNLVNPFFMVDAAVISSMYRPPGECSDLMIVIRKRPNVNVSPPLRLN